MIQDKKPTVLVVDDAGINLSLLSNILQDDYHVKIAKDGVKALEIIEATPELDLILLDIEMPKMNGYEVCINVKNNPARKHIPIIFITAKSTPEDEEYGLNLGAIDYITKPFSKSIVKLRVKNHIALKLKSDMLEKLSTYDSLTGVHNRRYFDESYEYIYNQAVKDKKSIAVFMMDIDFFKFYNDNYGHGLGDDVIIKVAKELDEIFSDYTKVFARYGGEEFVAIVENLSLEELQDLAKCLVKSIENLAIKHDFSKVCKFVTVSAGAVKVQAEDFSKEQILAKADEALYAVKNSGRNNFLVKEM